MPTHLCTSECFPVCVMLRGRILSDTTPSPPAVWDPDALDYLRRFLAETTTALEQEGVPEATRTRVLRRLLYGHPDGPEAKVTLPVPDTSLRDYGTPGARR